MRPGPSGVSKRASAEAPSSVKEPVVALAAGWANAPPVANPTPALIWPLILMQADEPVTAKNPAPIAAQRALAAFSTGDCWIGKDSCARAAGASDKAASTPKPRRPMPAPQIKSCAKCDSPAPDLKR